ncbi:hypothetical protein ACA910_020726 [Epithemia clementina (nom. ined.)]
MSNNKRAKSTNAGNSYQSEEKSPFSMKDFRVCSKCHGQGRITKPPSRKAKLRYKRRLENSDFENEMDSSSHSSTVVADGTNLSPPAPRFEPCFSCQSTGLQPVDSTGDNACVVNDLPLIAIVGGGIAGLALAIACRHRGIPHFVLERDAHFSQRRQGYGLTLQQASKALKYFGNADDILREGITSTKHVVHTTDGKVVGEWGLRKWGRPSEKKKKEPKRQNLHIARQALRYQLFRACDEYKIQWNSRLVEYQETETGVDLTVQTNGNEKLVTQTADLLVGADGIRSQVRKQFIGETTSPLRYLDCLVVLGICPLSGLDETARSHELLDGATVFQTADGHTRMYMMPYSTKEYMWQLSFPLPEQEASHYEQGSMALKEEAIKRCGAWHRPIPQILRETPVSLVSGYPVYDRALLEAAQLQGSKRVTLIGDACHPMSPFKGQGANQAMLDALSLANSIYKLCHVEKKGLDHALKHFEEEMLARSAVKVQASAEAVKFLHSDIAIQEGNVTRGGASKAAAATFAEDGSKAST